MSSWGLTVPPSNLVLGDNNLTAVRVVRSGDGMVEETNRPDSPALFDDTDLSTIGFLAGTKVGRIANDLLSLDCFSPRADADKLAVIIGDNLVDRFFEHVGTAVDGGQTSEGLREFPKSIERVDVGRLAITSHGGGIHDDTVVGGPGGFGNVTMREIR